MVEQVDPSLAVVAAVVEQAMLVAVVAAVVEQAKLVAAVVAVVEQAKPVAVAAVAAVALQVEDFEFQL